ncbi:MAG TPA: bifunctional dTDP-4-dehydrorhamnose 3,5-epimerase family protein/NAD(P)-dependent oxidoreductase [Dongiaceae bacterium]|nr:bifunctional dTDP-4-dehydrorhamnose 3,5-epimerase family protein/NAD(P)-dependent oxidoreductase [Dongiaceae bacterium]
MAQNPESSLEFSKDLEAHTTDIPGLVWWDLPVHGDNRGWFKENWQREKMIALGLPDFHPVQNNISFNDEVGTTRGIHAEPWDKYVSIASGKVFGAWVDLREGDTFGKTFTVELDPTKAIFVPRGVANSFQVLEPDTAYTYLVNDHWSPNAEYAFLNLGDPTIAIKWPISLSDAILSDKDKAHPQLQDVTPIKPKKTLITGANGQLGRALRIEFPDAEFVDRASFDISDPSTWGDRHWNDYGTIINAAAYTAVDAAETDEGRIEAWKANATAVQHLAKVAIENHITLVHVSSDYVFDGTTALHDEGEAFSPLNVYGQSKAAGDIAVATVPQHYIARTTWVVGEGKNFIEIMKGLAEKGVKPNVVNDQIGRLTFTEDLAKAIRHLVEVKAPYGTYNVTNNGEPVSWADIAKRVYELAGHNPDEVTGVSTDEYYADKEGIALRPLQSTLDLTKIEATGFFPRDWEEVLKHYLSDKSQ